MVCCRLIRWGTSTLADLARLDQNMQRSPMRQSQASKDHQQMGTDMLPVASCADLDQTELSTVQEERPTSSALHEHELGQLLWWGTASAAAGKEPDSAVPDSSRDGQPIDTALQGIGRYRRQHHLAGTEGAAQSAAGEQQQPSQSQTHAVQDQSSNLWDSHQPAQGLRRRSSFSKPVQGDNVKHDRSYGRHRHASEASSNLFVLHQPRHDVGADAHGSAGITKPGGDRHHAASKSGPLIAIRVAQPGITAKSTMKKQRIRATCGSSHLSQALQQSLSQVKACTLLLQEQRREQQHMQQMLHAMNSHTVAMLDKAIAAAVEQQLLKDGV